MTDIGVIQPAPTEDVQFNTNVQWSGNPGTASLSWSLDNGLAGDLSISPDTLSAKLITAGGDIEAVITCSAMGGAVSDSATVRRVQGQITAIGLTAQVVPKG